MLRIRHQHSESLYLLVAHFPTTKERRWCSLFSAWGSHLSRWDRENYLFSLHCTIYKGARCVQTAGINERSCSQRLSAWIAADLHWGNISGIASMQKSIWQSPPYGACTAPLHTRRLYFIYIVESLGSTQESVQHAHFYVKIVHRHAINAPVPRLNSSLRSYPACVGREY